MAVSVLCSDPWRGLQGPRPQQGYEVTIFPGCEVTVSDFQALPKILKVALITFFSTRTSYIKFWFFNFFFCFNLGNIQSSHCGPVG